MATTESLQRANQDKLFKSSVSGDFLVVNNLLREGVKYDAQDAEGWTAPGRAAQKSRSGVLQIMIDHGMSPNLTGSGGITLLHVAAMFNKLPVVKFLLAHSARPELKDEHGRTPIDVATDAAVKGAMQDVLDGKPPIPLDEYFEGEQVFCRDMKTAGWWPGIIEEIKGDEFLVHFPGFGKREDVRVKRDALCKVTRDNITRLQHEAINSMPRREKKASPAAAPDDGPKRRRVVGTPTGKTAVMRQGSGHRTIGAAAAAEEADGPSSPGSSFASPSHAGAAMPLKRRSTARLTPAKMAQSFDALVKQLEEQRENMLQIIEDYASAEARVEEHARYSRQQEQLVAKLTKSLGEHRDRERVDIGPAPAAPAPPHPEQSAQLAQAKATIASLQGTVARLTQENSALRSDLNVRTSRAAELETDKYQIEARIARLTHDIRTRDEEIARLRTEVEELRVRTSSAL